MKSTTSYWLSDFAIEDLIEKLKTEVRGMPEPVSFSIIERFGRDPFLILISCILSLRTKDAVTWSASINLFEKAKTPQEMMFLSLIEIEQSIYPVGFYRQKARTILKISSLLLEKYNGYVPSVKDDLLMLPGVGIKTAGLVLGLAFGIPALCVDTHVHRIANRLGMVCTKTPEETERALTDIIPNHYWIELNRLLVMWGQNTCTPISPFCSRCALSLVCQKKDVSSSR